MKLDRTTLKKLIVESLNEERGSKGNPRKTPAEIARSKEAARAEIARRKQAAPSGMANREPRNEAARIPKGAYSDDPSREWSTTRTHEDPSGPLPEERGLMDIADHFHKVADDLNSQIDYLKNMPKQEMEHMSDEEIAAGVEQMKQAQEELQQIAKELAAALAGLKK